jgi:hypothetical protein
MLCGFKSGFFLSKPCARQAAATCARCAAPFCIVHGRLDQEALCRRCAFGDMVPYAEADPDPGFRFGDVVDVGVGALDGDTFTAEDYAAMERAGDGAGAGAGPDDGAGPDSEDQRAARFES